MGEGEKEGRNSWTNWGIDPHTLGASEQPMLELTLSLDLVNQQVVLVFKAFGLGFQFLIS